jgi:triacylglycerol lipase
MTYPIVLAHGVCRFDVLLNDTLNLDNNDDPELDNLHYFKGIRTMLKKKGHIVYHSNVAWAAGVEKRADELKENLLKILKETRAEKVNIIAHSMGGLDARHMMFNDRNNGEIHKHVASLTTISTPHEGSPFADWGLDNLTPLHLLIEKLGVDLSALKDLRTDTCKTFNEHQDVNEFETACKGTIKFQTYAGKQDFLGVFSGLKIPFGIITKTEGENDGMVSVKSARWKDEYFQRTLDKTDHLNEIGWWDPDQLLDDESPDELLTRIHNFYARIAGHLP